MLKILEYMLYSEVEKHSQIDEIEIDINTFQFSKFLLSHYHVLVPSLSHHHLPRVSKHQTVLKHTLFNECCSLPAVAH